MEAYSRTSETVTYQVLVGANYECQRLVNVIVPRLSYHSHGTYDKSGSNQRIVSAIQAAHEAEHGGATGTGTSHCDIAGLIDRVHSVP